MSTLKRRKAALRSRARNPETYFASITGAQMASARVRALSGPAVRIWLYAHSKHSPDRPFTLEQAKLARDLHMRRATVSRAIKELIEARLLRLVKEAIRPGQPRMGTNGEATKGRAAEYILPHRYCPYEERGDNWLTEPGAPRFENSYWRVHNSSLRDLACKMSNDAARFVVCHVLPCFRLRDGSALPTGKLGAALPTTDDKGRPKRRPDPVDQITCRKVAEWLCLSARAAADVIAETVALGLLEMTKPAAGCAPALYRRAGLAAMGLRAQRTAARARLREATRQENPHRHGLSGCIPICTQTAGAPNSASARSTTYRFAAGSRPKLRANRDTDDPRLRAVLGTRETTRRDGFSQANSRVPPERAAA